MDRNDFLIPLNGLSQGRTASCLEVDKEFFESFGNSEILDADLTALVEVEKSGQYIGIDCNVSGEVSVACDRCLDPLSVPVDTTARLSIKFGKGEASVQDENDTPEREIVQVSDADADFDLAQVIYDYVCLSLPVLRMHPDGECNPQMLEYLQSGISVNRSENDSQGSPFAVLEGIFRK